MGMPEEVDLPGVHRPRGGAQELQGSVRPPHYRGPVAADPGQPVSGSEQDQDGSGGGQPGSGSPPLGRSGLPQGSQQVELQPAPGALGHMVQGLQPDVLRSTAFHHCKDGFGVRARGGIRHAA